MSIDSSFDTPEHFEGTSDDQPQGQSRKKHDQQRPSLGGIMDRALGYASEHRNELLNTLGNGAKANPIAAVLVTVGVLGLIASIRSSSSGPSADGMTTGAPGSARARIEQTAERMRNGTTPGSDFPPVADRHGRPSLDSVLPQDPVMLAVVGLALGAAIGGVLPSSSRERALVDLARDQLSPLSMVNPDQDQGSINEARHLTSPAGMAGMEGSDIVGDETDSLLLEDNVFAERKDQRPPPGAV